MRRTSLILVISILVLVGGERLGMTLGMPLERVDDHWTATSVDTVGIAAVRLEIVPARDPVREVLMWSVDETIALFNRSDHEVELHIGIPNAWSDSDPLLTEGAADFWAEAYVNGSPVETELVRVANNPGHPDVDFLVARKFTLRIPSMSSTYVRLLFALPGDTTLEGETRILYPFQIRTLWEGEIEYGSIMIRWRDRAFAFRTNLPGYALYGDRAEWFLREFGPSGELDIRFLPRLVVFRMVAETVGCPMPWEIVDRVSDGRLDAIREYLAGYGSDQLQLCADLPATLRGSISAARSSGMEDLRLEQFTPEESGITGPLFVPDPTYNPRQMTESEALYTRFLRQELESRVSEGTH